MKGHKELEKQSQSWNFDMVNPRKHLVACIKSKKLLPFPKVSLQYKKIDMDRFVIELLCPCGLPEMFGDMVACDRCRSGTITDVVDFNIQ